MSEETKLRDLGPELVFTFNYGNDEETLPYTIRLPLFIAWDVVEVIQVLGYQQALTFANFAIIVSNAGHSETPYPYGDELLKLQLTISFLSGLFGQGQQSTHLEDRVLVFTYQMLRHGAMSRKIAAEFAAVKLKKGSIDETWQEAWRKRVDRWAKAHKLPPVGRPRKPRKVSLLG